MSLTLKKKDESNLFSSVVYHVSFWSFFILSVVCYAILAINLTVYIVGDTLSTFTKQFIMVASERSASIARWCLVLVDELISFTIDYIDFDEGQEKVSSEKNSIKTILANASKRRSRSRNLSVSLPVNRGFAGTIAAPISPVTSTEDTSQPIEVISVNSVTNKSTELFPAISTFSELSLRKSEKSKLPLEQRYRPSIPSSLGQDRSKDWKSSTDLRANKRHSTPASEKQKRTISMKLINSTAANRVMIRSKAKRKVDEEQKSIPKQKPKPELKDKNINLSDDRPLLSQPPRTVHLNKTPAAALQVARRYLKVMMKVRKHRKTI